MTYYRPLLKRCLGVKLLVLISIFLAPLLASSFSPSSHTNGNENTVRRVSSIEIDNCRTTQIEEQQRLLPASSNVLLEFSSSLEIPDQESSLSSLGTKLLLHRCDGIDLYGREIVHSDGDAKTATMIFLEEDILGSGNTQLREALWGATLVIRPEKNNLGIGSVTPSQLLSPLPKSCFVAMNRFQVKEDCKALFEDRWAQRRSKLSYQPGFLSFSLLRKITAASFSSDHDRFNYSTCTIWDSRKTWEQWRSGGGKSSHEASRDTKRVPVSEWLEGPSSPIFWDGSAAAVDSSNSHSGIAP